MSRRFIFTLIFLEGFSLVLFEILGGKILNSFYGNSSYVWSFILVTTLFSLALGYFFGGRIANKPHKVKLIATLFLIFANLLLFTLSFSNYFFKNFVDYESFSGLLICCLFLIFPPLFILGLLGPIFIQFLKELNPSEDITKLVSKVYFISTSGGIFSALLCGFYILENFGILIPLLTNAALFVVLGFYFGKLKFFFKFTNGIVTFILISIIFSKFREQDSFVTRPVYFNEGLLGQLKVIDKPMDGGKFLGRLLLINGVCQTTIYNSQEAYSNWKYPHIINFFSHLKGNNSKTLLLGLGGGSIAKELKSRIKELDVVEIDKRIIQLAQDYFYLNEKGIRFYNEDARYFISKTTNKYDLVIYDVLTGEVQPNYVFTKEALSQLNKILNKDAIVIVNFQGFVKGKDKAFGSLYKTFKKNGFIVNYFAGSLNKADDIIFVLSKKKIDPKHIDVTKLNYCCTVNKDFFQYYKLPFQSYKPNLSNYSELIDDKPLLEYINFENIKVWRKDQKSSYSKVDLLNGISQFK